MYTVRVEYLFTDYQKKKKFSNSCFLTLCFRTLIIQESATSRDPNRPKRWPLCAWASRRHRRPRRSSSRDRRRGREGRAHYGDKSRPRGGTRRRGDDAATSAVKGRGDNDSCGAPGSSGRTESKAIAAPRTRYDSVTALGARLEHKRYT